MKSPAAIAALLLALAASGPGAPAPKPAPTETVLVTHRVKAGEEAEYATLLGRQWTTLRRLGLVLPKPHVILRGTDESGKTIFVEVLTWRDADAPDNAPAEVQAIWGELEARAEKRLGHKGIEFPEFEVVAASD